MAGLIEGGRVRATVYKACPVRDRREEESTRSQVAGGQEGLCPCPTPFPCSLEKGGEAGDDKVKTEK